MSMTREERERYYQSHEWGELKRAVHERAHGRCERCGAGVIDAVHHLTYQRLGRERLEDLQGLCSGCHEYLHGGKSDPLTIVRQAQEADAVRMKRTEEWNAVAVSLMSDPASEFRALLEKRTRIGWEMMGLSTAERDVERKKITEEMRRVVDEEVKRRHTDGTDPRPSPVA